MSEVVVKGLVDYVGDIVGAFTNEAQIKGKQIGKIDIKNKIGSSLNLCRKMSAC